MSAARTVFLKKHGSPRRLVTYSRAAVSDDS